MFSWLMEFCIVFSGDMNEQSKLCSGKDDSISQKSNQIDLNRTNSNATPTINTNKYGTIPTTIDGLIMYIAINGDEFEGKILAEMAKMNEPTLFR